MKVPHRTCVISREKLPKAELLRVVRIGDTIKVDETGRINGRGAYLKKDKDVINKSKGALHHHLKVEVPDNIIEELLELLD